MTDAAVAPAQDEVPPVRAPRVDARAVKAARLRVAASAARVGFEHTPLAPRGRGGARRSRHYLPIAPQDLDRETPALRLLQRPAMVDRVFSAATAALMSHRVAMAITRDAIAALPFDRAARDFALRHRNLTVLDGDLPDGADAPAIQSGIAALWVSQLPPVIAKSWDAAVPPLALPRPESVVMGTGIAALASAGKSDAAATGYVVPLTGGRIVEDRAVAALHAAIAEYCTDAP